MATYNTEGTLPEATDGIREYVNARYGDISGVQSASNAPPAGYAGKHRDELPDEYLNFLDKFWDDQGLVDQVANELTSAVKKHGFAQTPMNPEMYYEAKLVILVEEIGEVARAITYDEHDDKKLKEELIQVAAMALAWAGSLDLDKD